MSPGTKISLTFDIQIWSVIRPEDRQMRLLTPKSILLKKVSQNQSVCNEIISKYYALKSNYFSIIWIISLSQTLFLIERYLHWCLLPTSDLFAPERYSVCSPITPGVTWHCGRRRWQGVVEAIWTIMIFCSQQPHTYVWNALREKGTQYTCLECTHIRSSLIGFNRFNLNCFPNWKPSVKIILSHSCQVPCNIEIRIGI